MPRNLAIWGFCKTSEFVDWWQMWRLHKCFQYFTRKWIKDYLYHSCYFGLILYLSTVHTCSCYSQLPQLQNFMNFPWILPWFSHHWGSLRPTRYHLRHHLALAYLRYLPQHPVNTVTPTISPRGWIKPLISAVPVTDWTNDPGDKTQRVSQYVSAYRWWQRRHEEARKKTRFELRTAHRLRSFTYYDLMKPKKVCLQLGYTPDPNGHWMWKIHG